VAQEPAQNVLTCYGNLLAQALQDAEGIPPTMKTIELHRVVLAEQAPGVEGEGPYRLIPRPAVVGPVTRKLVASGKFSKTGDTTNGELLDLLFTGSERISFRPEVVWAAALAFSEEQQLDGRQVRTLSDLIGVRLALLSGVVVASSELGI